MMICKPLEQLGIIFVTVTVITPKQKILKGQAALFSILWNPAFLHLLHTILWKLPSNVSEYRLSKILLNTQ
jgi:hypothetical protein